MCRERMAKLTDYSKWDKLEDSDEEEVADRVRSCSPFRIEHGTGFLAAVGQIPQPGWGICSSGTMLSIESARNISARRPDKLLPLLASPSVSTR